MVFLYIMQVPRCGSFQKSVEASIFPALVAVDSARDSGKSGIDTLAAAVPVLLNTSTLTMPCREMCEAVVSTCGCNKDYRYCSACSSKGLSRLWRRRKHSCAVAY